MDGGNSQGLSSSPTQPRAQHQAMTQRANSWGSERAPSVDSEGRSTPRPLMVPEDLACEKTQVMARSYHVGLGEGLGLNQ